MSFLKKKRVKFGVDLEVCSLSDVPLLTAVLFAKVRLLDGDFVGHTDKVEVSNHTATWSNRFSFTCRVPYEPPSKEQIEPYKLEPCKCRISIRKESKNGKSTKLGYVDVNLTEFAASGIEGTTRSYLLEAYDRNIRQDNSKVRVRIVMTHHSLDPLFRVSTASSALNSKEIDDIDPINRKAEKTEEEREAERAMLAKAVEESPTSYYNHGAGKDVKDAEAGVALDDSSVSCASSQTQDSARRSAVIAFRRHSQDRSNANTARVTSTRIQNEEMIDALLAETKEELSANPDGSKDAGAVDREGDLVLYVDSSGRAVLQDEESEPAGKELKKVTMEADSTLT